MAACADGSAVQTLDDDPADLVEGLKQLSVARAQIYQLRYVKRRCVCVCKSPEAAFYNLFC